MMSEVLPKVLTEDEVLYYWDLKLSEFPSAVNLELTNVCNLRCHFCLNSKARFRERGFLSLRLLDQIGIGEPTRMHNS